VREGHQPHPELSTVPGNLPPVEPRAATDPADVLADVAQRLGASLDLTHTLEEVARSVVDRLGFGVAVLNLVTDEGDLEVVALAGPDAVRDQLLGSRQPRKDWEDAFAGSEPRGRLRFLDGRTASEAQSNLYYFVPDMPVRDDPLSWHPLDALFAPLYGADGALLGVLSVDLPHDGMRPDADDCQLLEVFAIQAALAIDHARLYTDLQTAMEEQKRTQAELEHRALHDALTGLANRELVIDRLDQALARSRRDGRGVAVLFLDVDHFKLVNDSLGHSVGDELLVALAGLLLHHLREVDTAGRLGGDEFVLVLEELGGPAEAIAVAERLLVAVKEPLLVGGEQVRASLSIGLSVASGTSTSSELLAEADAAMYRAKAAGRGRWEVFDAAMRSEALAHLALRKELSDAVGREEYRVFYQPIVELATGHHLGYEALLRWEHPTRGLLAPGAFLDVLEDSDTDSPVAEWVLERACSDAAAWAGDCFVSVNVSPRQLARPELARRVSDVLSRTGLPADRLWIEITEDRLIHEHQDIADVQRLRDLGVHVALDDFGTGYAGLTYLQRLPADTVKIDMVFVRSIVEDRVSQGIVTAVVGLATALGLQVVAEGVETQEQANALQALGVTCGQGYLWARPAPLPGSGVPVVLRPALLADDLPDELRRLQAALAVATDAQQVGSLAVQAMQRSVGADAGGLVVPAGEGRGRLAHGQGYADWAMEQFADFPLDNGWPICGALRDGHAGFLEQTELAVHVNPTVRQSSRTIIAMVCVPATAGGRVLGAIGASWTEPVALVPALREHLLALGDLVGSRLAELA
jgi:diguanylate cyclase (GGDEF)-like protein